MPVKSSVVRNRSLVKIALGVMALSAVTGTLVAQTSTITAVPSVIGFNFFPGPFPSLYLGHTEGDFTIMPTAGSWYEGGVYGSPAPSIFVGPTNAPVISVIHITDSAGAFTFGSLQFSSNNGNSSYDIQGFLGSSLQFEETGVLSASYAPFGADTFRTLIAEHSSLPLDGLVIEIIPGAGATSVNLDNIVLSTVPEPSHLALLALGCLALLRRRS